jgi:hypothetical protein
MQSQLERGSVVRMVHGMHIEREWHIRVAEFPDAIERFQAPGQAEPVDVISQPLDLIVCNDSANPGLARGILVCARCGPSRLPESSDGRIKGSGAVFDHTRNC